MDGLAELAVEGDAGVDDLAVGVRHHLLEQLAQIHLVIQEDGDKTVGGGAVQHAGAHIVLIHGRPDAGVGVHLHEPIAGNLDRPGIVGQRVEDNGNLRLDAVDLIQYHIAALHEHLHKAAQLKVGAVLIQSLAAQQVDLVHVRVALDTGQGLVHNPADRVDQGILAGALLANQADIFTRQMIAQAPGQVVVLRRLQEQLTGANHLSPGLIALHTLKHAVDQVRRHRLAEHVVDPLLDVPSLHDPLLDDLLHVLVEISEGRSLQADRGLIIAAPKDLGRFYRNGLATGKCCGQLLGWVDYHASRGCPALIHGRCHPHDRHGLRAAGGTQVIQPDEQLAALVGVDIAQDIDDLAVSNARPANLQGHRAAVLLLLVGPNREPVQLGLPAHTLVVLPVGIGGDELGPAASYLLPIHLLSHRRIGRSTLQHRLLGVCGHIAHQIAVQESLNGTRVSQIGGLTAELHHSPGSERIDNGLTGLESNQDSNVSHSRISPFQV